MRCSCKEYERIYDFLNEQRSILASLSHSLSLGAVMMLTLPMIVAVGFLEGPLPVSLAVASAVLGFAAMTIGMRTTWRKALPRPDCTAEEMWDALIAGAASDCIRLKRRTDIVLWLYIAQTVAFLTGGFCMVL